MAPGVLLGPGGFVPARRVLEPLPFGEGAGGARFSYALACPKTSTFAADF